MAEKNVTSSMTSVTEEDTSADSESDTTETYSNVTSSALSSNTDYNTDDKLTPGLNNIKISKTKGSIHQPLTSVPGISRMSVDHSYSNTRLDPKGPLVMSSSCYDLNNSQKVSADKSLLKQALWQSRRNSSKKRLFGEMDENLGIEDPDDRLSTDFSDTSSRLGETMNGCSHISDSDSEISDHDVNGECKEGSRPFLPNMASNRWYEARCFDRYWSNYYFVMEWYRQHVQAVASLMAGQTQEPTTQAGPRIKSGRKARSKSKRAHLRARKIKEATESSSNTYFQSEEEEEEMEMAITDDMMAFFVQSMKHKIERENEKSKEADAINAAATLDSARVTNHIAPSVTAPREQPGVRRTTEMRALYGVGAAMVHGMETALQMTFDHQTDRFQPKLWPNMPLKIVFH